MSDRHPHISIGLPVYNGGPFFVQAMQSLLEQTYGDFELIICDNASTDDTESISREFAARDARVRYHRNEKNLGAAPNFNCALALATGRYFKWAAHDDLYGPTYLERCVAVLDADPSAILAHSRTVVIDEQGCQVSPPHRHDTPETTPEFCWEDLYEMPRRLDSPCPPVRFQKVLLETRRCFEIFGLTRREAMLRTGGHASFYGADKVILSSLSLMGRLVEVPEPLFFRRHHTGTSANIRSVRAREAWINTSQTARSLFPRVRCLRGYCQSVLDARLNWREQAACFVAIFRYITQSDRWMALLREPR